LGTEERERERQDRNGREDRKTMKGVLKTVTDVIDFLLD